MGKILDSFYLRGFGRGRYWYVDLDAPFASGNVGLACHRRFVAPVGTDGRSFRRHLVVANDKCLAFTVVVISGPSEEPYGVGFNFLTFLFWKSEHLASPPLYVRSFLSNSHEKTRFRGLHSALSIPKILYRIVIPAL